MTVSNFEIHPTENQDQECFKIHFQNYDLENSFVIGDRKTDCRIGEKIWVQIYFISDETNDGLLLPRKLDEIYQYLKIKFKKSESKKNNKGKLIFR